jgi:copper homeostasis protein
MRRQLEACVDSVATARMAEAAGADRLELCANLAEGGITPSMGLISTVVSSVLIPVHVLVRPRPGGFHYVPDELEVIMRDIVAALDIGAAGVVVGLLEADGRLALEPMRDLVADALSEGAEVTMHRAFDHVRDQAVVLEQLVEIGVARVLTSGGAATALEGADRIAALQAQARARITIMAGGGIRRDTIRTVLDRTGVTDVHVGGPRRLRFDGGALHPAISFRSAPPPDEAAWYELDGAGLQDLVAIIRT